MDKEGFIKMCSEAKSPMSLTEAIEFTRYLIDNECNVYIKLRHGILCHDTFVKERFQEVVCEELYKELQKAPPWADYREVIAELMWPHMYRVLNHIQNDRYNGPYGEKVCEADTWFVEMWTAYYILFLRMPGICPNNRMWTRFDELLKQARKTTAKYRRKM